MLKVALSVCNADTLSVVRGRHGIDAAREVLVTVKGS